MRLTQSLVPTLKEAPAEATAASHVLLVRGGFIRKVAAGIYNFLPLGWRVARKVERIVREELDRAGAIEVHLPTVVPAELWKESGRWEQYGDELLRLTDRRAGEFCLGPTHEEVIVDLVRRDVRSYRQLPLNLYQIQTKFRDEPRPRAGLLRGREFIMKDAYSFDVDEAAARRSYRAMYDAYERIFRRCGLDFRAVEADTGNIGGTLSHEFQVLADSGEDAIVACDACDYAANVEKAELRGDAADAAAAGPDARDHAIEEVATPGRRTIAEVSEFLGVPPAGFLKTLIYVVDGKHAVAAVVRGDREVNELKLRALLGAREVVLAGDAAIEEATGGPQGFSGPLGLKIPVLVDAEVARMGGAVAGANRRDLHLRHVRHGRDFEGRLVDLRQAAAGDRCARCDAGSYRGFRGIEVGHVFHLGTRYSAPMKCNFLDEAGVDRPMVMGCYGIGITRTAAAAVEQNHDAAGICWPAALAPYQVALLPVQMDNEQVRATGDRLYADLAGRGVEVMLDDRDERAGVKFKDADLIGLPWRVVVGAKALAQGAVEVKPRRGGQAELVPVEQAAAALADRVQQSLRP